MKVACAVLMHADRRRVDRVDSRVVSSGKFVYDTTPPGGLRAANGAAIARSEHFRRRVASPRKLLAARWASIGVIQSPHEEHILYVIGGGCLCLAISHHERA